MTRSGGDAEHFVRAATDLGAAMLRLPETPPKGTLYGQRRDP
ncbi:hypothetical protein ACFFX1_10460 [Dactylosporangium sucinum]|nr:hypothetical protein [Dactylosporangium sucinum]